MQKPKEEIEKPIQPKTQRQRTWAYAFTMVKHKEYRNKLRKNKEQQVRNQLNVIEESIDSNHFWEY
jgi:hypothetical protein